MTDSPLDALHPSNNLELRLTAYAAWLGRTVSVWHGDIGDSGRRRMLAEPPDVLLTTPESLESVLVSALVDHHELFRYVRTIVVDEVHAFAGDDRGWHLLAVLERLTKVAGRLIQRVGLSATVGNPDQMLTWLQGSGVGTRPGEVVAPQPSAVPAGTAVGPTDGVDVELDFVGSIANTATVIAALHRGEKRLVFCDSKRRVEELGEALRALGVSTYLSHASLSKDERRRAEQAFADDRDCVIVATSTLELGIDVGDLDRVFQLDAPATVAAFM
ncbi:helicase-related protein [Streptomyces sp. NPDC093221]|uniref:helicase-related protein n=1 Tax=Streptomyces sp. NPDC093221 TaxID=3366032 RepID=UPI0037F5920B